jgi:hypothetical protein
MSLVRVFTAPAGVIRLPGQGFLCDARAMSTSTADLLFDRFSATAVAVAEARPQVDPAMIREIFEDAATMLHNGLALDHLDDHDAQIVVGELCAALSDPDPTAALMTRFYAATENPHGLDDPIGVALAYENVLGILRL